MHIEREVARTQRLENLLTLRTAPNVGKSVQIIGPAGSISEPNTWVFTSIIAQSLVVEKGMTKETQ